MILAAGSLGRCVRKYGTEGSFRRTGWCSNIRIAIAIVCLTQTSHCQNRGPKVESDACRM